MSKQLGLMATRRNVLQAGLLVGAVAAVPAEAANFSGGGAIPIYKVIQDDRFPASRMFGQEAERLGVPAHAIRGGIHDLWYNELSHQWRERPLAIAGMTTHHSLFLLAMMGQEVGLRVVLRLHHQVDNKGVSHSQFGPLELIARLPELSENPEHWSCQAAHIVASWPKWAVSRSQSRSTILAAETQPLRQDALITWVMAPVINSI